MSNKIRIEVHKRIVLSKMLYRAGESACTNQNDPMVFTKGILLLHDAAEAALGAVADHLHAVLKSNHYLLDYYALIKNADSQKRTVPYYTQMRNLNARRIDAKHLGMLPDPKNDAYFSTTVYELISDLCKTYLGVDFPSISLKSLIRRKDVLEYIGQAEKEIDIGKIEDGLISLAYAMYHICESSTLPWSFFYPNADNETGVPFEFTQPYTTEYTVQLVQHGVDPFIYYRFMNLTPRVARHKDTGELAHWWNKYYGHPANWTAANACFCLNFCIETALKFQREENLGYELIRYPEVFEDVIEPTREKAIIWNNSIHPPRFSFQKPSQPRSPVLTLEKGHSIVGYAQDSEDRLDEWFIMSENIPLNSKKYPGFGFALKSDVKVTRSEKRVPESMNDSEVRKMEK